MSVGVLALQGCVQPHIKALSRIGVPAFPVRARVELERAERLILPGGESTTMLSLLALGGMFDALSHYCKTRPVLGVCAGAILLATEVFGPSQPSLGAIPLRAHRNYYGCQLESFEASITIIEDKNPHEVQFIRAPLLQAAHPSVTPIGFLDGLPVLFQYRNVLAASFHSELGEDSFLHQLLMGIPEFSGE